MFSNRRHRAQDQSGFTLIELLVVILIIGILAAIAIPAFLNQRAKGYDAAAKSNLNTAETAMQVYASDHAGAFPASVNTANASTDSLDSIEPELDNPPYVTGGATANGYTLTAMAVGPAVHSDTFSVAFTNGFVTRTCTGTEGGCIGGTW